MQIIPPVSLSLHGSGTPVYVHPEWVTATAYTAGTSVVRVSGGTGTWFDYRCLISHTSASGNYPLISGNPYWQYLGPSAVLSGTTPSTNVMLTSASTWSSGSAVTIDTINFDPSDMSEYVALIGIGASDNTTRPSLAILSSDPLIASRWKKLGAANAWAFMDYEMDSKLTGINGSGTIVNPVFTISIDAGTSSNRIAFTGLVNVASITAKVYIGGSLSETKSATLTATTFSYRPETAVIELTAITAAANIEVTLTRDVSTIAPRLGKIAIGYGYGVADTHWGVETGILSFSRKERDATYGTVKLLKRNSARRLRAQCSIKTASATGDAVQRVLQDVDGRAVFWDFNNTGTTYDRCRIFGFFNDFSISPLTPSHELLAISVEGLVGV